MAFPAQLQEPQEVHFEAQAEPPPSVMQEQQELEHEDAEPSETSSRSAAKSFTVAMRMSNGAIDAIGAHDELES